MLQRDSRHSRVAQLAEQVAVNHPVGGSNPSPGATLFLMAYIVYILRSESTSTYYVGHTDDLLRRTSQHNDSEYHGSKHTKRNKGPWVCVYSEQYDTRAEAIKREKEIKAKKSRKYIEFLLGSRQSPESLRD